MNDRPFKSHALLSWKPGESDFLSQIILKLKGPHQKEVWNFLGLIMAKTLTENKIVFPEKCWITCCPSKTGNEDHAARWAQSLSQALNLPFLLLLRYSQQDRASFWRHKSGRERRKFARGKHEVFTRREGIDDALLQRVGEGTILFADDIITTGATAGLAHKALGKPRNFTHLALVSRTDIDRSK